MYLVKLKQGESRKFVFATLKAIYKVYTVDQIGCKVANLWNSKIRDGGPFENKKCVIKKVNSAFPGIIVNGEVYKEVK